MLKTTKFNFLICVLLAIIIMCTGVPAAAIEQSGSATTKTSTDILDRFYLQISQIKQNCVSMQNRDSSNQLAQIQAATVEELNDAGYDAYSVTPETFSNIEEMLDCDLKDMGLSPVCSYIIIVGNNGLDGTDISPQTDIGSSYNHTYNGKTYVLRRITVTAVDDSNMYDDDKCTITNSATGDALSRLLNTAISFGLDSISTKVPIGTVLSLLNVPNIQIDLTRSPTIIFHGAAAWTRIYTQVKDDRYGGWASGCFVEYVKTLSFESGTYYDKNANAPKSIPRNEVSKTQFSPRYSDNAWRNDNGVYGMLIGQTRPDSVGSVYFYRDGNKIMTLYNNYAAMPNL